MVRWNKEVLEMKKILILSFLMSTLAFTSAAYAQLFNRDVIVEEVVVLSDGSFVIIADSAPGGECTSKWHSVKLNRGGLTSEKALEFMFSTALAANVAGTKVTMIVDTDDDCFVSRLYIRGGA